MKGIIDCTIPQRQFENIKISCEFNNETEYNEALDRIINACVHLNGIVHKKTQAVETSKSIESAKSIASDAWKKGTKLETKEFKNGSSI